MNYGCELIVDLKICTVFTVEKCNIFESILTCQI